MGKHTPGPWDWHAARFDDGRNNGSVVAGAGTSRATCVCKAPQYAIISQWKANARLIAAAPELLEALKKARKELAALPEWISYGFTHLPEIDAAIAKAEGKE